MDPIPKSVRTRCRYTPSRACRSRRFVIHASCGFGTITDRPASEERHGGGLARRWKDGAAGQSAHGCRSFRHPYHPGGGARRDGPCPRYSLRSCAARSVRGRASIRSRGSACCTNHCDAPHRAAPAARHTRRRRAATAERSDGQREVPMPSVPVRFPAIGALLRRLRGRPLVKPLEHEGVQITPDAPEEICAANRGLRLLLAGLGKSHLAGQHRYVAPLTVDDMESVGGRGRNSWTKVSSGYCSLIEYPEREEVPVCNV